MGVSRGCPPSTVKIHPLSNEGLPPPKQHTKDMVLSLAQLYCAFASLTSNYVATAKELGNTEYANTPRTLVDMYHNWAERQHLEVGDTGAPLYKVLSMVSSGAQTSNELDRLYAFFGLNIDSSITLRPNYSFDIRQALISTVTSIIKGTSMLDMFDIIPRVRGSENIFSIPSWVPNLLDVHLVIPFQTSPTMVCAARDRDTGSESTEGRVYPWRGTCTEDQLHVRGRVIDILESQIPSGPDNMDYTDNDEHIFDMLAAVNKARSSHGHSHARSTPASVLQALKAEGYCVPSPASFVSLAGSENPEACVEFIPLPARQEKAQLKGRPSRSKPTTNDTSFVATVMRGRHLWTTQKGRLAAGSYLRQGDVVCVLHGCSNPVALRVEEHGYFNPVALESRKHNGVKPFWSDNRYSLKRPGTYRVLGTCYLDGCMDPWSSGKVDWREEDADTFILV
jgi:hypothetical protein